MARTSGFSIREVLRIERGRGTLAYDDWRALAGGLGVDVSEIVPADVESSGATLTSTPEGGEDEIPWEQFDLELEEFVGRVRDDLSSDNGVLSEALASLDTEDPRVASPPPQPMNDTGTSSTRRMSSGSGSPRSTTCACGSSPPKAPTSQSRSPPRSRLPSKRPGVQSVVCTHIVVPVRR